MAFFNIEGGKATRFSTDKMIEFREPLISYEQVMHPAMTIGTFRVSIRVFAEANRKIVRRERDDDSQKVAEALIIFLRSKSNLCKDRNSGEGVCSEASANVDCRHTVTRSVKYLRHDTVKVRILDIQSARGG